VDFSGASLAAFGYALELAGGGFGPEALGV